jgi:hypothetical protein
MARETKAQRLERMEAELKVAREAERVAYPVRLMAVLERLNNQYNTELKVMEGLFVVKTNATARFANEYSLSYSYNEDTQSVLQELEWELDALEEAQAEERRKREVRENAKRKAQELFTPEEREALGL